MVFLLTISNRGEKKTKEIKKEGDDFLVLVESRKPQCMCRQPLAYSPKSDAIAAHNCI